MKNYLAFLFIIAVSSTSFAKEPLRVLDATVAKVSDGDTLVAFDDNMTKLKVRLYGIDAPEAEKLTRPNTVGKKGQLYGAEAHAALSEKVIGRLVKLHVLDIDKYRRIVCLVYLDGVNINELMVREGNAWAYRKYLSEPFRSVFLSAESLARTNRQGLWLHDNPQPPWEFRNESKR